MAAPLTTREFALKKSAVRAARNEGLADTDFEVYAKGEMFKIRITDKPTVKNGDHGGPKDLAEKFEKAPDAPADIELNKEGDEQASNFPPAPTTPGSDVKQAVQEMTTPAPTPAPKRNVDPVEEQLKKDFAEAARRRAEEAKAEAERKAAEPKLEVVNVTAMVEGTTPSATTQTTPPATTPAPRVKKGGTKIPKWAVNRGASEIQNPVAVAWALADEMTAANGGTPPRRRDYIQEAEKRGLAFGTARSQYQSWFTARRESEANAAKANEKK